MSATWDTKITVISISAKVVSVCATRTDTTTGKTSTYYVARAVISTPAQKLAVINSLWDQHQEWVDRQTSIGNLISTLEADANDMLQDREP